MSTILVRVVTMGLALGALAGCAVPDVAGFGVPAATPTHSPAGPVTVYADEALSNVIRDIRTSYLLGNAGQRIELRFGAAEQGVPDDGGRAAVAVTADTDWVGEIGKAGRLAAPIRALARDPLAVVIARPNPKTLLRFEDLNRLDYKAAIAAEDTPLGRTTRAWVKGLSEDAAFGPDFPAQFYHQAQVVADSAAVVEAVTQNRAQAGVVYGSEANFHRVRVKVLPMTTGLNVETNYTVAVLAGEGKEVAAAFADYLFGAQAQALLRDYGLEIAR